MSEFEWLDQKHYALSLDAWLARLAYDLGLRLKPGERQLRGRRCAGCSSFRFCVLGSVISVN